MTIQTQVMWAYTSSRDIFVLVEAKGNELTAAGKEIGEVMLTYDSVNQRTTAVRTWIDEAAAQEWIDFVQEYDPVSAVILN
jgi:hypothetical protein